MGRPPYSRLNNSCKQTEAVPDRAARCAAVAEKLWSLANDSTLDPMFALRLISSQVHRAPVWTQRARELEAAMQFQSELYNDQTSADWIGPALRCQPVDNHPLIRFSLGHEWMELRKAVQAEGAETLAARYRAQGRRDLLAQSR